MSTSTADLRARHADELRAVVKRAHATVTELDQLERTLRAQHNHDLGHGHTWTVRGAEVLVRCSREQLYSAICTLSAHLGIPVAAQAERVPS